MSKKAIIIGAGPAGLTAAYELLKRTDIKPIILEKSGDIGGISKTINYKGNRMDIGGHRFFSKSERVMKWWLNIMPVQPLEDTYTTITYQRKHHTIKQEETHSRSNTDDKRVMLIRKRLSRIYFLRRFFNYPIQLSIDTLRKLGFVRTIRILLSYLAAQLMPRKPEKSLEDFMINRFGKQLYLLFFKDYTEKVWGVPCNEISAEWGAQRIKGVSISKAIQHAAQTMFKKKNSKGDISQKDTETSLIEQFLYPALGPGQLWEEVARQIEILGGTILMHQDVKEIKMTAGKITSVVAMNSETGETTEHNGEYFFSTMPVQELIAGMNGAVPGDVKEVAAGLQYRDFITVGVLLERPTSDEMKSGVFKPFDLKDTWIYIQEKDVKVGRLQLFNNWSPYMVNKPGNFWIGMEYFCNKGDEFWSMTDEEIKRTAIEELEKMGLAQVETVIDSTVQRVEKTYPAYFGTYNQFDKIRAYVDQFENLFLVGRNGMHKYNNADHSMLTAMTAVDNICEGITGKENIWAINTEQEYHETKNKMEHTDSKSPEQQQVPTPVFQTNRASFSDFLFQDRKNRMYLLFALAAIIIQFSVFKYFYPYPSFIFGDSWVYLNSAFMNSSIDVYTVGYSNFLRLFSVFTHSDTALVAFQYLLLQGSSFLFVMSIYYFFNLGRFAKNLLFVFAILNPVYLYLANTISSDAYFISLSITWMILLIWIIEKPNARLIILQVLVIYLAFSTRYNALYYPVIAALAMLISRQKLSYKLWGISASIIVIALCVWHTSQKYYEQTGIRQFSPFSGWQIANNALYAYRYVDSSDRKPAPKKLQKLDNMVRHYFDTTRNWFKYPHELQFANTYYMWRAPSPLQQYGIRQFKLDTTQELHFRYWAKMGPLYNSYGYWLIKQYPGKYLEYYLLPNAAKYYAPPVEYLDSYNMWEDTVARTAQNWFQYKTNKVFSRFKNRDVIMLNFLPILIGCLNALFVLSFLFFLMLKELILEKEVSKYLWLTGSFWLVNFGFSVLASPVSLRFQIFPTLIFFAGTVTMIDIIFSMASKPTTRSHNILTTIDNFSEREKAKLI